MVGVMREGPWHPFDGLLRAITGHRGARAASTLTTTQAATAHDTATRRAGRRSTVPELAAWRPTRVEALPELPPVGPAPEGATPVERARAHLERHWTPSADRWLLIQQLIVAGGCSRHEAEVLVAERDAVERARRAGLDPAPVRVQAERLLHDR